MQVRHYYGTFLSGWAWLAVLIGFPILVAFLVAVLTGSFDKLAIVSLLIPATAEFVMSTHIDWVWHSRHVGTLIGDSMAGGVLTLVAMLLLAIIGIALKRRLFKTSGTELSARESVPAGAMSRVGSVDLLLAVAMVTLGIDAFKIVREQDPQVFAGTRAQILNSPTSTEADKLQVVMKLYGPSRAGSDRRSAAGVKKFISKGQTDHAAAMLMQQGDNSGLPELEGQLMQSSKLTLTNEQQVIHLDWLGYGEGGPDRLTFDLGRYLNAVTDPNAEPILTARLTSSADPDAGSRRRFPRRWQNTRSCAQRISSHLTCGDAFFLPKAGAYADGNRSSSRMRFRSAGEKYSISTLPESALPDDPHARTDVLLQALLEVREDRLAAGRGHLAFAGGSRSGAHRIDEALGGADGEVLLAHALGGDELLAGGVEAEQRLGVADAEVAGADPRADLFRQREQAHGVGDGDPPLPDLLRDLLLRELVQFLPWRRAYPSASSIGLRSARWRFSMSASSSTSRLLASRTMTGSVSSPASPEARQRRSPAMSSYLPLTSRTMSGWMMPRSLIESTISARSSALKFLRGWSGLGTMALRAT